MSEVKDDFSVAGDRKVLYRKAGKRRLFTDPDPDRAREFFRDKSRSLEDKLTTVSQAVSNLISDGDYLGVGGFGSNRIPTALLHEILRQEKKGLGFAGHTSTHDMQILVAGDCIDRCDVAYIVGLEARGLSPGAREAFESGRIEATEWTNAALAWRYRAAAMGVSFLPVRMMMGTETLDYSAGVEIPCPFTDQKYVAVPALYPEVALIHVHRSDRYGNAQIEGITVSDLDLARAAKRVIITAEEIIPTEEVRRQPDRNMIPYFLVDAVIEVPYGAYPSNMAYHYFSDEEHLQEWLEAERDASNFQAFLEKNIYGVKDHAEYIEVNGGLKRLQRLRSEENIGSYQEQ